MKTKYKFFILLVFSFACSVYMVMDYVSLPTDESKVTLNADYHMWTFIPGDGKVTFGEDIVFWTACPVVSLFLFVDILKEMNNEKDESN
jgi:hypothetical protein